MYTDEYFCKICGNEFEDEDEYSNGFDYQICDKCYQDLIVDFVAMKKFLLHTDSELKKLKESGWTAWHDFILWCFDIEEMFCANIELFNLLKDYFDRTVSVQKYQQWLKSYVCDNYIDEYVKWYIDEN